MRNKISPSRRLGLIFCIYFNSQFEKELFPHVYELLRFWKYEWLNIHSLSRLASFL